MGAVCSKKSRSTTVKSAGWDINRKQVQVDQPKSSLKTGGGVAPSSPQPPRTDVHLQKDKEEQFSDKEDNQNQIDKINPFAYESDDEFYDGIPRYPPSLSQKSSSFRSKQAAAKVTCSSISHTLI